MIVDLFREDEHLFFVLRTPNHATGNLITNLAKLCDLPVSADAVRIDPRYVVPVIVLPVLLLALLWILLFTGTHRKKDDAGEL